MSRAKSTRSSAPPGQTVRGRRGGARADSGETRPNHGATSGQVDSRRPREAGRRQVGRSHAHMNQKVLPNSSMAFDLRLNDRSGWDRLVASCSSEAGAVTASKIAGLIGVVPSLWFSRSDRPRQPRINRLRCRRAEARKFGATRLGWNFLSPASGDYRRQSPPSCGVPRQGVTRACALSRRSGSRLNPLSRMSHIPKAPALVS